MEGKIILDACCGSKMSWFDKKHPNVLYCDKRSESHTLCDGRILTINPDLIIDFKSMPFDSNTFSLVVFDPPHLTNTGENSYMAKKYGTLNKDWKTEIRTGFSECMRVLKPGGTLIFKWNETRIKLNEILSVLPNKPLFGHTSGRQAKTIWMAFFKF